MNSSNDIQLTKTSVQRGSIVLKKDIMCEEEEQEEDDLEGYYHGFGYSSRPPIKWWAWLDYGEFHGQTALKWWVGFLFMIGACFFTFVGITELFPQIVIDNAWGWDSLCAWLVVYPTAIGAIGFFWTASLVNYLEAINGDYDVKVSDWKQAGAYGEQPRLRVFSVDYGCTYWWGAVVQVTGTTSFGVAAVYGILSLGIPFEPYGPQQRWFQWFPYAYGGAAFLTAGFLFALHSSGSCWRGIIPTSLKELCRLEYLCMWFYFWGSVGFCMSGFFFYASPYLPWHWWALQQAIGYGLGSFLFLLSAWCNLLEISNPHWA